MRFTALREKTVDHRYSSRTDQKNEEAAAAIARAKIVLATTIAALRCGAASRSGGSHSYRGRYRCHSITDRRAALRNGPLIDSSAIVIAEIIFAPSINGRCSYRIGSRHVSDFFLLSY